MKVKGFLVILLCAILLIGCTNNNKASQPGGDQQENINNDSGNNVAAPGQNELNQEREKISINIGALKGPTAMGMVQIMENAQQGETANDYNFYIAGTADEISTGLVKGDFDIAAIPGNLASILYNRTQGEVILAGINTLGVLYIVETGEAINSIEDLKGKTIYSMGLGTTPQFTLNYLLTSHGIDPEKDVTIEYKTEATEVAAILSLSSDAIAMLPQPFVTTVMMNNSEVRIALDITKEWEAITSDDSTVVTGVVVVRKEFLENNREAVDEFLSEYTDSAAFVNEKVEEAAELVEKFDIFKAPVAKRAIPFSNITMIKGDEMKGKVDGYLRILFDQNPQSVGGQMPEEDFYYIPQ